MTRCVATHIDVSPFSRFQIHGRSTRVRNLMIIWEFWCLQCLSRILVRLYRHPTEFRVQLFQRLSGVFAVNLGFRYYRRESRVLGASRFPDFNGRIYLDCLQLLHRNPIAQVTPNYLFCRIEIHRYILHISCLVSFLPCHLFVYHFCPTCSPWALIGSHMTFVSDG